MEERPACATLTKAQSPLVAFGLPVAGDLAVAGIVVNGAFEAVAPPISKNTKAPSAGSTALTSLTIGGWIDDRAPATGGGSRHARRTALVVL